MSHGGPEWTTVTVHGPPAAPRRPRPHRQHAAGRGDASRHRLLLALPQARIAEPRRLDQGPDRPVDDRSRRARRPPARRRHGGRGHRGQHRARPGAGRACQGLPRRPGRSRQDVEREGAAPEGARRRSAHDAQRRRQGSPRLLPGLRGAPRRRHPRVVLRRPVQQPREPARPRADDGTRALAADGSRRRRHRRRHRLVGHADRIDAILPARAARGRVRARRSRRFDPARPGHDRHARRGRLVGGRRHRRRLRAADRRPVGDQARVFDPRRGKLRDGARAAEGRGPARRLVDRNAARRGAALLPPRPSRSASSASSATPARATSARSTTTPG